MSLILNDSLYERIKINEKYETKINNANKNEINSEIFNMMQQDNPDIIHQLLFDNNYSDYFTGEMLGQMKSKLDQYATISKRS